MRNFHHPGRSTAYAINAMAATSSGPATLAALDVLRHGGNAVDAAVTASAVLCVTEPHMTGIGGDCFVLIGRPDGGVEGLNGSGRSARRADADWLKKSGLCGITHDSIHAVTVPGAIDAWAKLLAKHGTIDLAQALEPAIRLAEQGCPVAPRVASDWAKLEDKLARDEGASRHFLPAGRTPRAGEIMRYPALTKTLRVIAKYGRDGFYAGEIAEDIVAHLKGRGSLLTSEDFAATDATWVDPISTVYRDHELLEIPPNGQGITALIALNALKHFDLARHGAASVERRHIELEAVKLAWILRNRHVADSDHAPAPIADLLSEATAGQLAGLIRMDKAFDGPEAAVAMPASDTVYLTVVDRNRLAVSFINSIYDDFGSGIVTPETGIALQSRGAGFNTDPGHPNCIGPAKRPLHTIIPAMVRAKAGIVMSFGVMGGDYQPMGHTAMMLNRFVYGMDPQEAIDFPRALHKQGVVGIEDGISDAVADGLQQRGHVVERIKKPWGGGQAIVIDHETGVLIGGSDPRKDGLALGF
ncbi:MAG TPA: gamma-glutamyltransferase [Aestuariivirgaceae bacterium]|nr:gamma-glutamyltransferase [Aestuariivirgaceae bacterium]